MLTVLSYFGTRQWNFQNENVARLVQKSKTFKYRPSDKMEFDLSKVSWNKYFVTYWPGIQKHLDLQSRTKSSE